LLVVTITFALVALLIALISGAVAGATALTFIMRRMRLKRKSLKEAFQKDAMKLSEALQKDAAEGARLVFDDVVWPQIESLLNIHRLLDGKMTLPPTRRWAASPDFLLHVVRHIEKAAPRVIVECGAGTSTVAMAAAMQVLDQRGHIYSLENHAYFAEQARQALVARGLERFATVVLAPLVEKRYAGEDGPFYWYNLDQGIIPEALDLLLIDGPVCELAKFARYPAAPELFSKLRRNAHIFLNNAGEQRGLVTKWRTLFPDLGFRELPAEKGALEMFFLDEKIEAFLPTELLSPAIALWAVSLLWLQQSMGEVVAS
jgi:predicted O-methyltransferase YrrM